MVEGEIFQQVCSFNLRQSIGRPNNLAGPYKCLQIVSNNPIAYQKVL